MRHNKKINHLGRTSSHRTAMLANMCISLIISDKKRIFTTLAKAKAVRKVLEPIITKSKTNTVHMQRLVSQDLRSGSVSKKAVQELFHVIAPKVADRPGGYTRIIKTGYRLGDNAAMCFIELVDFNDDRTSAGAGAAKQKTTRRSRRGAGAKATDAVAVDAAVESEKAAPKAKAAAKTADQKEAPKAKAAPKAEVVDQVEVKTEATAEPKDETPKKDEE